MKLDQKLVYIMLESNLRRTFGCIATKMLYVLSSKTEIDFVFKFFFWNSCFGANACRWRDLYGD